MSYDDDKHFTVTSGSLNCPARRPGSMRKLQLFLAGGILGIWRTPDGKVLPMLGLPVAFRGTVMRGAPFPALLACCSRPDCVWYDYVIMLQMLSSMALREPEQRLTIRCTASKQHRPGTSPSKPCTAFAPRASKPVRKKLKYFGCSEYN